MKINYKFNRVKRVIKVYLRRRKRGRGRERREGREIGGGGRNETL